MRKIINQKLMIDTYFRDKSIVSHNIESFNKFVKRGIQRIVNEIGEIYPNILPPNTEELKIKFGKVWVEKPSTREADGTRRMILPMEARLRDITYDAPIMLEMSFEKDGIESEKKAVQIGSLPIMVKSEFCNLHGKPKEKLIEYGEDPYDPGGYFIINGTERVIVIMEDLAPNKVFVEKQTGPLPWVAKIFSEDEQMQRVPHLIEKAKDGMIYVTFTRLNNIPFVLLLKALGLESDKEIIDAIEPDEKTMNDLYINLYETGDVKTMYDALEIIGKRLGAQGRERRIARAEEMIDRFFLPHVGHGKEDRIAKAYLLAKAVKKLIKISNGDLNEDDKDHYSNKRLRLCGDLLANLFRHSFRILVGDIMYNFERLVKRGKLPSLQAITRSQLLTSRIRSALATGEWVGGRHGISQHLERANHFATISHLGRVVSSLTSSRENFEARDLHPTHWGKLCACETPEGPSLGLRKNLALTCEISTECDVEDKKIVEQLASLGLKRI